MAGHSARPIAPLGGASRPASPTAGMQPLRGLVAAGFVARGLTYALIGAITLFLAVRRGPPPASPDQQGALTLVARIPLGSVLVTAVAVGLLAYAVWKLALAVIGYGPEGGGGHQLVDRAANLGGALVYFTFCAVAVRILVHTHGTQSADQQQAAAGVLGWPAGHWVVALGGLGLIAISAYQLVRGVRGGFADDNKVHEMNERQRHTFLILGRVGLTARAIVFALVGYFLVRTAIDFRPSEGVGVDGMLAQLRQLSYGPWLLGLVSAGVLVFAVFSLYEARYQRL